VATQEPAFGDQAPVLYGRDPELRLLTVFIDNVRRGGQALVVSGEAGIGKSSLLASASVRARASGMRVLVASGSQSETNLPFAGLHQLLRPLITDIDHLPILQREALHAAFGITLGDAPDLFLIALAALNLLAEAAAREPLILICEDAQWLDRPTCDVLTFIARRLDSDPMVELIAIRDDFQSPLLEAGIRELHIVGLAPSDAGALLDTHAPDLPSTLRTRLLEEAAGNPLALVELPAVIHAEHLRGGELLHAWLPLSERLERAFAGRLAELPVTTREALLIAAADDRSTLAEVLTATAVIGKSELTIGALDPAVVARFIEFDEVELRFRHPLVRSAIYQAASLPQRQLAHAALAEVIADHPDRRAWHRAAATISPDDDVAAELEATALRAQQMGGLAVAVSALERAAQLTRDPVRRGSRLLQAAELATDLGRGEVALKLVSEAVQSPLTARDKARLLALEATLSANDTASAAQLHTLVEAADEMQRAGDSDIAVRLLMAAALRCYMAEPTREDRAVVIGAIERLGRPDTDSVILLALAYAAPVERGAVVLKRLIDLEDKHSPDAVTSFHLGTAAALISAFDLAAKFTAAAIKTLREQGRIGLLSEALMIRAWAETYRGNANLAWPAAEEARQLAHESSQPFCEAGASVIKAIQAAIRGDGMMVDALAAEAEIVAIPTRAAALLCVLQLARGVSTLADGQYERAYDELFRVFDPADPAYHFTRCWAIGDLAEAAVHCGREAAARNVLVEMEVIAQGAPLPWLRVGLAYARPLLADERQMEQLYIDGLAEDMTSWPFFRGRLELAYGTWLRRHRRVAESRVFLRTARDRLDALGALPWSSRARQELRASGESSRARNRDLQDELTPQELQVAHLVGNGLSNREIGHQLFLSPRTVGAHLYHIFPKLGITSRAQLRHALDAATTKLPVRPQTS
jgi:DNA-binding CsgD family transcriptional regulator